MAAGGPTSATTKKKINPKSVGLYCDGCETTPNPTGLKSSGYWLRFLLSPAWAWFHPCSIETWLTGRFPTAMSLGWIGWPWVGSVFPWLMPWLAWDSTTLAPPLARAWLPICATPCLTTCSAWASDFLRRSSHALHTHTASVFDYDTIIAVSKLLRHHRGHGSKAGKISLTLFYCKDAEAQSFLIIFSASL